MNLAAIDIGSGTVKLNIFRLNDGQVAPLELHEIDTQLRRGMGDELTLKDGPVAESFRAVAALQKRAREFEVENLAVYATSAVRRAKNPEILLDALMEELALDCKVLSEAEEGRLNLYGAQTVLPEASQCVAVDPGGDSTDAAWGPEWQSADFASLPFGSVALMEKYHEGDPAQPISEESLQATREAVVKTLKDYKAAAGMAGQEPLIRMNEPMRLCLARVQKTDLSTTRFEAEAAWQTALALAAVDHRGRMQMLEGEPEGKLDRTAYGYASWAGLLDFLKASHFACDPYGIKLGAPLAAWKKLGPWSL